jgi:hypothetical protein
MLIDWREIMRYKGFIINPVYSLCADWRLDKHGSVVAKRVKPSDIEYYEVLDPIENGKRFFAENTIVDCQREINRILHNLGMKDNTQKSWDLLEN